MWQELDDSRDSENFTLQRVNYVDRLLDSELQKSSMNLILGHSESSA